MSEDISNKDKNHYLSSVDTDQSENAYEVEEQLFQRHNYDDTSMFEMDIEKAKVIASTSNNESESTVDSTAPSPPQAKTNEKETNEIRRSLAELHEKENQKKDEYIKELDRKHSLLGKLKIFFS